MSQQLCSQQQVKQGGGDPSPSESQNQNPQAPATYDQGAASKAGETPHNDNTQTSNEYHVPVFGSQLKQDDPAGPATNANPQTQQDPVKPFTLKG